MKKFFLTFLISATSISILGQSSSLALGSLLALTSKDAPPIDYVFGAHPSDSLPKNLKQKKNNQFDSLSRLIVKNGKDPQLYILRGDIRMSAGAYTGAKGDYDKAYALGSRKKDLFMKLGEVNYKLGSRSNSITYFNSILKKDSANAQAYLRRGITKLYIQKSRLNSLKERCEEAKEDFALSLRFNQNLQPALILHGYVNYFLEQNEAAVSDLTTAVEQEPPNELAFLLLGKTYLEMDQHENACKIFKRALELHFEVPDRWIRKSCAD